MIKHFIKYTDKNFFLLVFMILKFSMLNLESLVICITYILITSISAVKSIFNSLVCWYYYFCGLISMVNVLSSDCIFFYHSHLLDQSFLTHCAPWMWKTHIVNTISFRGIIGAHNLWLPIANLLYTGRTLAIGPSW